MYSPRAAAITTVEHMDVGRCVENDVHEMKEDAKKKQEYLYPVMSTVTLPLSSVKKFSLLFSSV